MRLRWFCLKRNNRNKPKAYGIPKLQHCIALTKLKHVIARAKLKRGIALYKSGVVALSLSLSIFRERKRGIEREKETERQSDRERHTERQRQTDRQTDREKGRERENSVFIPPFKSLSVPL